MELEQRMVVGRCVVALQVRSLRLCLMMGVNQTQIQTSSIGQLDVCCASLEVFHKV